jgi:hypothetical protein
LFQIQYGVVKGFAKQNVGLFLPTGFIWERWRPAGEPPALPGYFLVMTNTPLTHAKGVRNGCRFK